MDPATRDGSQFHELRMTHGGTGLLFLALASAFHYGTSVELLVPVTVSSQSTTGAVRSVWMEVSVPLLIRTYLLIAALHHLSLVLPGIFTAYVSSVKDEANAFRWSEYTFSASIMTVVLALVLGIDDFDALLLIAVAMGTCNLGGLAAERTRSVLVHVFAWIPFSVCWVVLTRAYLSGIHAPLVDFLFPVMFAAFVTFGIIQVLHMIGVLKRYVHVEYAYTLMSLATKTLMALILFLGAEV